MNIGDEKQIMELDPEITFPDKLDLDHEDSTENDEPIDWTCAIKQIRGLVLDGITFDKEKSYKKQYEGRNLIVPTPVKKKIERITKKMKTVQM